MQDIKLDKDESLENIGFQTTHRFLPENATQDGLSVLEADLEISQKIQLPEETRDIKNSQEQEEHESHESQNSVWVQCEHPMCRKWRRIPQGMAEKLDRSQIWYCRLNPDPKYARCSVAQEKSNEEINHELGISDSDEDDVTDGSDLDETEGQSKALSLTEGRTSDGLPGGWRVGTWTLVHQNVYLSRKRKHQEPNEVMVCLCRPDSNGAACGDSCLNRMLNIECLSQYCPCGQACSNQQFQRGKGAQLSWTRAGRKGFGLSIQEPVAQGSFIIEYVGEVLNEAMFVSRQKQYSRLRLKHYYFMTVSSTEVIDASWKGNLSRFLNHSCEPNCRLEKWLVDGEICVGLFAVRDIAKGEEVTFDYNWEHFAGARGMKCLCGAPSCRGVLGSKLAPLQLDVEDSSTDSAAEDSEPVMLIEDDPVPAPASSTDKAGVVRDENKDKKQEDAWGAAAANRGADDCERRVRLKRKRHGSRLAERRLKVANRHLALAESLACNVRAHFPGHKSSKAAVRASIPEQRVKQDRFSPYSLEEELNELLGKHGGLRRRKDAAEYLKLMVRATMGSVESSSAGASCRDADLSMLLDALLKTTYPAVMREVLQKQGLRMLQTLGRQIGSAAGRRPIVRKFLQVLEHCTRSEVLTDQTVASLPWGLHDTLRADVTRLQSYPDQEVRRLATKLCQRWALLSQGQCPSTPPPVQLHSTSNRAWQKPEARPSSISMPNMGLLQMQVLALQRRLLVAAAQSSFCSSFPRGMPPLVPPGPWIPSTLFAAPLQACGPVQFDPSYLQPSAETVAAPPPPPPPLPASPTPQPPPFSPPPSPPLPPPPLPVQPSASPQDAGGTSPVTPPEEPCSVKPDGRSTPPSDVADGKTATVAPASTVVPAVSRPKRVPVEETWENPSLETFHRAVEGMVRHRIDKHKEQLHGQQLDKMRRKLVQQVITKEQRKFTERQSTGQEKPICRRSLILKVAEFVDSHVRAFLKHQDAKK